MEKITYPLLYFELPQGGILGLLVGTEHQIIDTSLKNVKQLLQEQLQKQYKKYDDYPYVDLASFQLRILDIPIRPVYRQETRSYPLSELVQVKIPIVYGPTESSYDEGQTEYQCYLPTLSASFYFQKDHKEQMNALVRYFVTEHFMQEQPEVLYRTLIMPQPKLDELVFRGLRKRKSGYFSDQWQLKQETKHLNNLADQYPQDKVLRRNLSVFPEAAWELEDQVRKVVEQVSVLKANVLLVGESGLGKSAVLKQAIKKMTAKSAKLDLTFWQLIAQRITAQARYLGEWQENVEKLIQELRLVNGVLWVLDLVQLLQMGGEGAEDSIAAFLVPFLQSGKLQLVGEASPAQLESMRRLLPGFVENFQILELQELSERKIHSVLEQFCQYLQQQQGISIEKNAQEMAYRLLLRYYPYESFPGKGIKFLAQCVQQASLQQKTKIGTEEILAYFTQQTGMPPFIVRDDVLLDQQAMRQFFQQRIIGQDSAIEVVMGVVKIFKAGLNNPHKPISTLLFTGPTGVGKTACAKALADYFFGMGQKRSPLVRIDMSEFQHPAQLARFIGAGGEVGKLVQDIRERPFSVLLLDEIEKADPSVFDALLTVLDEGHLVDNYGRVTNFKNTIIIMTSNLGASSRGSVGYGEGSKPNYEAAVLKFFRPEFVNRIDHIVPFEPLLQDNIKKIIDKELQEIGQREGIAKRKLHLRFHPSLPQHLLQVGFDERYGARPLQRALENEVIAPLAEWLLLHPQLQNRRLTLEWKEGRLQIFS